jgi:hypothetical protein
MLKFLEFFVNLLIFHLSNQYLNVTMLHFINYGLEFLSHQHHFPVQI